MKKCFCDICEKEVNEIELLNLEYETIDKKKGSYAYTLNGILAPVRNKNKGEICAECAANLNEIIYNLKKGVVNVNV